MNDPHLPTNTLVKDLRELPEKLRRTPVALSTHVRLLQGAADEIERLTRRETKLVKALEQFANCDLNEGNCASLEVATRRIKGIARAALKDLT